MIETPRWRLVEPSGQLGREGTEDTKYTLSQNKNPTSVTTKPSKKCMNATNYMYLGDKIKYYYVCVGERARTSRLWRVLEWAL